MVGPCSGSGREGGGRQMHAGNVGPVTRDTAQGAGSPTIGARAEESRASAPEQVEHADADSVCGTANASGESV